MHISKRSKKLFNKEQSLKSNQTTQNDYQNQSKKFKICISIIAFIVISVAIGLYHDENITVLKENPHLSKAHDCMFFRTQEAIKRGLYSPVTGKELKYGDYSKLDSETKFLRILNTFNCDCKYITAAQILFYTCPKALKGLGFKEVELSNVKENSIPFSTFLLLLKANETHLKRDFDTSDDIDSKLDLETRACSSIISRFLILRGIAPTQELENLITLTLDNYLYSIFANSSTKLPLMNPKKGSILNLENYHDKYVIYQTYDKGNCHTIFGYKDTIIDGPYVFKKHLSTMQLDDSSNNKWA